MQIMQSVKNPTGINVFGSALIRVAPDIALITLVVSSIHKKPEKAFEETRKAASALRAFLSKSMVNDVQSSQVSLSEDWEYTGGGRREFQGYKAKISFNVVLEELTKIESITCGAVSAGANEITSVTFQTRHLKEIRKQARTNAVAAAFEKAEVYAKASKVTLGPVIHIEDVNPETLQGREGHVLSESPIEEEGQIEAIDPGAIAVGAAVLLCFEITNPEA